VPSVGGPYVWIELAVGLITLAFAIVHLARPSDTARKVAIACALIAVAGGVLGTILGMKLAYDAAAGADPTRKASLLAERISESMNCSAFGVGALLLWIPLFVIAEMRYGRRAKHRAPLR
jgi:hypothetical protein